MRSEFEKIEWVKERLNHVWWSQENGYCDTGKHPRANASFLNGALHLFMEQHPKINELQKLCDELALSQMETASHNAELQKRVDAALKLISEKAEDIDLSEYRVSGSFVDAKELEQALKGGEL